MVQKYVKTVQKMKYEKWVKWVYFGRKYNFLATFCSPAKIYLKKVRKMIFGRNAQNWRVAYSFKSCRGSKIVKNMKFEKGVKGVDFEWK